METLTIAQEVEIIIGFMVLGGVMAAFCNLVGSLKSYFQKGVEIAGGK